LVDSGATITLDWLSVMSMAAAPWLQEKLAAILAICRKMNSERDLSSLLDLVAREATALLDADRASIFLLDRERNELWSKVALGSDEILRFDAGQGIAGLAARTGECINVTDARRDPRFYGAIDDQTGYRTETLLAVPLRNQQGETVGAFEALNKRHGVFTPRDEEVLQALAGHAAVAIETAQLVGRLRRNRDELEVHNAQLLMELDRVRSHGVIGVSTRIQNVVRLIERIRDTSVNVLITGESGTGKELAARAIHYSSPRSRRPFVALNCAALPEALVESELFGIEKGVATGVQPRIGQFQMADGGTLFLDEIGDLSLVAQAKILRVLQERVLERVGGRNSVSVDVRILAATNKELEEEIQEKRFREDLYYRLKVIHIHMPPLREIPEDIPLLAHHFLAEYGRENNREPMELSPAVLRRLVRSAWPGNSRQLRNEVYRLAACAAGRLITDDEFVDVPRAALEPSRARPVHLKKAVADLELRIIREALHATGNNQQRAAKALGLSRQGLINKMKRYGIKAADGAAAQL
jgi:Nif-specific regulatory protein